MDAYEIIDMERKSSMAERLGNVIHWTAGGIAWLWIAGFGVFILGIINLINGKKLLA